ncbi:MAG: dTDP-4-dehydrorhamnose reductase [Treponema sp.]|jgi:dTDP-4-dehydrorhamnose reductase|nr:dTDP-4-dehydrorhamnose reductase [Treponema sp.]
MIWLIGSKGMLGTELSQVLEQRGLVWVGSDREVDITDPAALDAFIAQQQGPITWIVNCVAYTAVDQAEDDPDACRRVNADGPAYIARAANRIGAKLLHFSTDYVFNGKVTVPYKEDNPTDPIGVYGLTKRDGEAAILANHGAAYILRTAWLYGRHGNNFVRTMLRLMNEREEVRVVNDQRGSPTWVNDLANTAANLIMRADSGKSLEHGIYQYTNEGEIAWFEFAQEIYAQGKKLGLISGDCAVRPCASAEYPSRVTRPTYSVLDKGKIKRALGIAIPRWDASLKRYLETCAR